MAPVPGVGQWEVAWGQEWESQEETNPRGSIPSVGEHLEPAQLCHHSLHSWIHPERGETCCVFKDVSALGFSGALGGYWRTLAAVGAAMLSEAPAPSSRAAAAFAPCNKTQQVIEGTSVPQKEPGATSCLSPAPGQDTQEVTGQGSAGGRRMVTSREDCGIIKDMWCPPRCQSSSPLPGSSLSPRCHPKGHLSTPSLLSHTAAHPPRKSKDLMLL